MKNYASKQELEKTRESRFFRRNNLKKALKKKKKGNHSKYILEKIEGQKK
jgi:hypothetical protein